MVWFDLQVPLTRKEELSLLAGCILWEAHVVIPPQGRAAILHQLHVGDPGKEGLVISNQLKMNMNEIF